MITVDNFIDYLAAKFPPYAGLIFNGFIDRNQEQAIGVYSKNRNDPIVVYGHFGSLKSKSISILVHWGRDADAAENVANAIYVAMETEPGGTAIGSYRLVKFDMMDDTPVNISRDDNGICEYTIRAAIYYN